MDVRQASAGTGRDRVHVVMALAGDFEDLEDRPIVAYFDRRMAEEHKARAEAHLARQLELQRAWVEAPDRAGTRFRMEPSAYDPAVDERWTAYWVFEVLLAEGLPGT